jgi:hypothetical protein
MDMPTANINLYAANAVDSAEEAPLYCADVSWTLTNRRVLCATPPFAAVVLRFPSTARHKESLVTRSPPMSGSDR